MLSKYIKELIENNNRIIIPDFGAFMVQDAPEGKQISFNDFLKFNDGLLINQIIKSEKISKNEATDKVKEFIKSVEQSFTQKKPYELKGLGFLTKDTHGNIKFQSDIKDEKPKTGTSPTDVKPTIVLDEKQEQKQEKEVEKRIEKKEEPKKTVIPPKPTTQTKPTEKKLETTHMNTKKPTQVSTSKPVQKPYTAQKSNNNAKNVIIIGAIVVILFGGTWALFYFDIIPMFWKKPVIVEEPVTVVDTTPPVIDTTPVEPEPKVVEEIEPKVDPNAKKYYIVAGSFKVPTNAQNFNEKLINEGYDSEIVVRRNGFHVVSYKTVFEWNNALLEWRKMRNTNPETWILIK